MNNFHHHQQKQHHHLYLNQWNKLFGFSSFGWKIIITILLVFNLIPSIVYSQNVDYLYHHRRAYRQSNLPSLRHNNRQQQPQSVDDSSIDDYIVDNNYEKTRFKFRSDDDGGDGRVNIFNNQDKGDGGYRVGDTFLSSFRALDDGNINDNDQSLHREQPQYQQQHQQVDNQNEEEDLSTQQHTPPRPSSQMKASGFNVDSSHPVTMFARALSSARIHANSEDSIRNFLWVSSVIGVTFIGIFVVIATGFFVHRINVSRKAAADIEYPAYGVVGPGASLKEKESLSTSANKPVSGSSSKGSGTSGGPGSLSPSGDRRLAQSAQMYHYHHQKQQMISSDKVVTEAGQHPSTSEVDSEEEENEEGDYTVYECPGLASTGEMEVKNPLFQDDITPISSPSLNNNNKHDGSSA